MDTIPQRTTRANNTIGRYGLRWKGCRSLRILAPSSCGLCFTDRLSSDSNAGRKKKVIRLANPTPMEDRIPNCLTCSIREEINEAKPMIVVTAVSRIGTPTCSMVL
jgi:hypothetical protein